MTINRHPTYRPLPDWLSMQYDSFQRFFSKENPGEFSFGRVIMSHSSIPLDADHTLEIADWHLLEPNLNPQKCRERNVTYCRELRFDLRLRGPSIDEKGRKAFKLMALIPTPTPDGEFVMTTPDGGRANRYTLTMQLALSPGIFYSVKSIEEGEDQGAVLVRTCRINPVIGQTIIIKEKHGKRGATQTFLMDGLKMDLLKLADFLNEKSAPDQKLVRQVYKYLLEKKPLPPEQEVLYPEQADRGWYTSIRRSFLAYLTEFDMSKLGKQQMVSVLGDAAVNSEHPLLTLEELKTIISRFIKNEGDDRLSETDDRSLKYRRVKLVGDFLFEQLDSAMRLFVKQVRDTWGLKGGLTGKKAKGNPGENPAETRQKEPKVEEHSAFFLTTLDWLIPFRFLQEPVNYFFAHTRLRQLLDDTNPLAEISQKRRLTFRGPGGVPDNVLFLDKRDVHPTDYGRLCPVESPQGEDLGFNLYLAQDARINDTGLLASSFKEVKSGEELFFDPYQEESQVKAFGGEEEPAVAGKVRAKTREAEILLCNPEEISHTPCSRQGLLGYAASLVPFLQHNDANRALMAANMMKQAILLLNPEPPMVVTGFEAEIGRRYGQNSPFVRDGKLCLGCNLLTGYLPWDLRNYEDGLVISDRMVRNKILTHLATEPVLCEEIYRLEDNYFEFITPENEYLSTADRNALDDRGIIRVGEQVTAGTVLVSRLRPAAEKEITPEERTAHLLLKASLGETGPIMRDASLCAPKHLCGVIKEVDVIDVEKLSTNIVTKLLPPEAAMTHRRLVRLIIEGERPVKVGDKLTGRHGNKGVVAQILPEAEMPFLPTSQGACFDPRCRVEGPHQHLEIMLNPLTITARMNLGQLYETTLGLIAHRSGTELKAPPFDDAWTWEKIAQKLDDLNLKEKQVLYCCINGEQKQLVQAVTVGYQYFCKLKHLAEDKLKARDQGNGYSPGMGQPTVPIYRDRWQRREAKQRTPQRLGEMEVWALEGHSAWAILDEFISLKSDADSIRQRLLDHVRNMQRDRRRVFWDLQKAVGQEGWKFCKHGKDRQVFFTPSERSEQRLRKIAGGLGLKITKIEETATQWTFLLEYAALDLLPREHRAFKSLVHYCRALGLEFRGLDVEGKQIKLAGEGIGTWPTIHGLTIRLAKDSDREGWSRKPFIIEVGSGNNGLWSDDIFGKIHKTGDKERLNESTGIIKLPFPIDNPIFRPVLRQILDREGFALSSIRTEVQAVISKLFPDVARNWADFWKEATDNLPSLQTMDELVAWLANLSQQQNTGYSHQQLSLHLKEALPQKQQFNFKRVIKIGSPYFFNARELYQYFKKINLEQWQFYLETVAADTRLSARQQKLLYLIETLRRNHYQPADFFIQSLLVLPKNLRFEQEEGDTLGPLHYENDLNYFYRHIILNIQKLQNIQKVKAPEILVRWEEEKLRRLVHGLLVNDQMADVLPDPIIRKGKVLNSILGTVCGRKTSKEGLFRKHLLGKRVDFSGRGVIIPDPDLDVDQVGLPFEMGAVLFRDLLIQRILADKIPDKVPLTPYEGLEAPTSKNIPFGFRLVQAKAFLRDKANWDIIKGLLTDLAQDGQLVLLNRAPSLHRLSMLAFHPQFHEEDRVLRLNPYVCAPFNADFDGDTMGIFAPILPDSKKEAAQMLPPMALRSPGHGRLVISHGADLALAYYLGNSAAGPPRGKDELLELMQGWLEHPEAFVEALHKETARLRNILTGSGFSLGVSDFLVDVGLPGLLAKYWKEFLDTDFATDRKKVGFWQRKAREVEKALKDKLQEISKQEVLPLHILMDSKAAKMQLGQFCGMRGIMLRPGGKHVPYPVMGNIFRGLSPLEYFVSCHGSRHGLSDKGLMTAPAGDLTNILIQAAQGIFIVEENCGTQEGLYLSAFDDPSSNPLRLSERLIGRYLAEAVTLNDGETLPPETLVTPELAKRLDTCQEKWVKVRSPLTCRAVGRRSPRWQSFWNKAGQILSEDIAELNLPAGHQLTESDLWQIAHSGRANMEIWLNDSAETVAVPPHEGLCKVCYGWDLATNTPPPKGFPVGVIAAQSIGEPGTQLTLRTFHTGGVAGQEISQGLRVARRAFYVGTILEQVFAGGTGQAAIIKTPNGLDWLEIQGHDEEGKEHNQRLPLINYQVTSGWTREMERQLQKGNLALIPKPQADGTYIHQPQGLPGQLSEVKAGQTFPVIPGQRLFLTPCYLESQNVEVKKVFSKYGRLGAAEYLLHCLQKIYNTNSRVADHHFEVILGAMLGQDGELRTVLGAGFKNQEFLARLAFRQTSRHLMEAAINRETDWLMGLKEKIITGLIRRQDF